MYYADLHMHSIYSDGKLTVKEIIEHAKQRNLKAIAITDHDTITGTIEAIQSPNKDDLDILPGIEFSTIHGGEEIHILGYLFDVSDEHFAQFVQQMQNQRFNRADKMIEKFHAIGIPIDKAELIKSSQNESVGRPHFARLLVKMGYVDTVNEAFNKYLLPGTATYVERYKLPTGEAIKEINKASGLSILAHPGCISNQHLIEEVIQMNVDGIEVYHPENSAKQTENYYRLAKENGLYITGGSDNHSDDPRDTTFIGSIKIPYSYVEELRKAKGKR